MREIKFRAWDNVKNRIYFIGEEDDIGFNITSSGFIGFDLNEEYDSPFQKLEHLKYMQFTGLKDKNGKEIYEGDVLSVNLKNFAESEGPHKYIVDNFTYDLAYLSQINQFIEEMGSEDLEDFIEVIGNIYENPELLEDTQ